jgi:HK97 family phage major capsid protein
MTRPLVQPTGENKTPHPSLVKAAELLAQARAIQEEFKDDPSQMPADVAGTQQQLLDRAKQLRDAVTREVQIKATEDWLAEPQYDTDPSGSSAKAIGHGMPLLEGERQERQAKAFWSAVRNGKDSIPNELKADLVLDADGQLLVPHDFAGAIIRELPRLTVLRQLAFVRPTTSNVVDVTDLTSGQIGWNKLELPTEGSPADATPGTDDNTIAVHDLVGLVKFGRNLLEDEQANLESTTRELISLQFAEAEDDAFAAGTGGAPTAKNGQPAGIAGADFTGRTVTASANTLASVTAEDVKSLKYRVSQRMRRNGVYLAHSSIEEHVALMRDNSGAEAGTGQFLWQPSVSADEPATFSGKRWYTLDGLPEADADTTASLVFGDVRQGYMIADRRRMTLQRLVEKYATEGKVGLLFTHRVGGGVIRDNAFAALVIPENGG